jgi:gluconate 5-dehydrogenase
MARALARAGADLVITSRSLAALEGPQRDLEACGHRVTAVELDVRSEASIAAATAAAAGPIDVLVNNAGCNVRKPALDVTWDEWNTVLDTNLCGSFFVSQAIARQMVPRGRGRILMIGSITSVFGFGGLAPYTASRGGIRQLTMSLADALGPHGITVNCLAPGSAAPCDGSGHLSACRSRCGSGPRCGHRRRLAVQCGKSGKSRGRR